VAPAQALKFVFVECRQNGAEGVFLFSLFLGPLSLF
jgi:hypothetical protein